MPERILLSWDDYQAALGTDHVAALVTQALELIGQSKNGVRAKVEERLKDKVSEKTLRSVGKAKLEALVGWLLVQSQKPINNQNAPQAQREAA